MEFEPKMTGQFLRKTLTDTVMNDDRITLQTSGKAYLQTPMDRATLLNAKSTTSTTDYCLLQWRTEFLLCQATSVC